MMVLPENWKQSWQPEDPFDKVLQLQGEEYRNMDGRRTLRFEMDGRGYFAKIYTGLGWSKILKSLLSFRKPPVSTAANEWQAIKKLEELGVETMTLVGYGERGFGYASKQSFVITEELANTESLEDFCADWRKNPPGIQIKRALIQRLAQVSRQLHENGMNHRDYYLCHFLIDVSRGRDLLDLRELHLYLIDLHRMQFRARLPYRWRLKDIVGLYFSSMEIGLTQRDLYRFITVYTNLPLRTALNRYERMWRQTQQKGKKMLKRYYKKYCVDS